MRLFYIHGHTRNIFHTLYHLASEATLGVTPKKQSFYILSAQGQSRPKAYISFALSISSPEHNWLTLLFVNIKVGYDGAIAESSRKYVMKIKLVVNVIRMMKT